MTVYIGDDYDVNFSDAGSSDFFSDRLVRFCKNHFIVLVYERKFYSYDLI